MLLSRSISPVLPSLLNRSLATSTKTTTTVPLLLSPTELSKLLSSSKPPVVIDASWHMPNLNPPRNGFKEFKTKRILGSSFFDLDVIANSNNERGLSHMLPTVERFQDACSRLGISRDSHVVCYDTTGVFSSPRAAYTFKAFGHEKVSILDGGLPRWISENHPIDTSLPSMPNPHASDAKEFSSYGPILSVILYDSRPAIESYFIGDAEEKGMREYEGAVLDEGVVRSYEEMVGNSEKEAGKGEIVLDARPAGRFHGTAPEPRAGLSSGHIPNSLSVPFPTLLTPLSKTEPPYQTLLPAKELVKVFEGVLGKEKWKKVKSGEEMVTTTCGSGMTAAVLVLALKVAGRKEKVALYDESWTGYSGREESKIIKSE